MGFEPKTTEFRSDTLTDLVFRPRVQLTLRAKFKQLLQFHRLFSVKFPFGYSLHQSTLLFWWKISWVNHMSVVEWTDTYGIHHWTILWSSFRKLAWVGFEPTTTELRSDSLIEWAICFIFTGIKIFMLWRKIEKVGEIYTSLATNGLGFR